MSPWGGATRLRSCRIRQRKDRGSTRRVSSRTRFRRYLTVWAIATVACASPSPATLRFAEPVPYFEHARRDGGASVDGDDSRTDGQALQTDSLAEDAEDPGWQLTAWILPAGAAASAMLTVGQTITGGLGRAIGYPAALALALLCVALV